MQTRSTHEIHGPMNLTELCRRLLTAIEARVSTHDRSPTTWILPLQHLSFHQLRAPLEALKGEPVGISGTPHTLVLAGPCAEVHALGEMIIHLNARIA